MSKNNGRSTDTQTDPGTALMNPVTVAEMTASYNKALRMIDEGYQLLHDSAKILSGAFGGDQSFQTIDHHHGKGPADIKQQLHRAAWRSIINRLEIKKVLSIKRNEELDKRLENGDLPPITDEEIITMVTTLQENIQDFAKELALEVYDYFRPAVTGSRWEKAYVTNQRDGRYDLGKKVIIGWMIQPGYSSRAPLQVNYRNQDKLFALDRVFHLLDGKEMTAANAYTCPLVDAINTSPDGFGETEYFKFRACLNGNLHIEFTRLDLLQKLNEIAGNPTELKDKRYKTKKGDKTQVNVPRSPEAEAETFREDFYWTPGPVIARMLELCPLASAARILEPSAGEGHIVDGLVGAGAQKDRVTCFEINPERARKLRMKGYKVEERDFLTFHESGWDLIYMNPPFGQEQDLRHVMHAYSLLAKGGSMAAVMSKHGFYAGNQRSIDFRAWFNRVGAQAEDLPESSFRAAGTDWDTRLVVIKK